MSEKSNCAGIVAADILSAVEGGILLPGPAIDFTKFSNFSAGSAGLEAPALRQAGKPAATFFRHTLKRYPQQSFGVVSAAIAYFFPFVKNFSDADKTTLL
jgi:hypothetical protein